MQQEEGNKITLYEDEMAKLERQQRELHDQHNQENQEWNSAEYARNLRATSTLKYAFNQNQTLESQMGKLQIYVEQASEKNNRSHVWNQGRGCWFTHKDKLGYGCFMCEDVNLYSYLFSIIQYLVEKHPEDKLTLQS